VEQLAAIVALQLEGLSLEEIGRRLGGAPVPALPAGTPMVRYALGRDIAVEVRAGLPPWRVRRIEVALSEFAARVAAESNPISQAEDYEDE
jgi:hypothetical protein